MMSMIKRVITYHKVMTLLWVVCMIVGFALISHATIVPVIATNRSNRATSAAVAEYLRQVAELTQDEIDTQFYRAERHNQMLNCVYNFRPILFGELADIPQDYTQILNIGGTMARLVIPAISVDLPILHGTTQETMARGVGHLEGSSLPIGGYGTHSALTTHSGKPTATLFNRLEEIQEGDIFIIYVLDRRLTYEVDRITVIEPNEVWHLRVDPDEDLVTLITCTPIQVNTHRLLVRGRRV